MNVFEVEAPTPDQAREIGIRLFHSIRMGHEWGKKFDEELSEEVLELLSKIAPREMRRAFMTAFGNARLANRWELQSSDFPDASASKKSIGFLQ